MDSCKGMIIKRCCNLSGKERRAVDEFIRKETTNGEFINTLEFLDYHPAGRFKDDSIVLFDSGSSMVRAVVMAAQSGMNVKHIISHPGTTFAGPIIDRKYHIENVEKILDLILNYYENLYDKVEFRLQPAYYSMQAFGMIDYFLLKRNYMFNARGLANIINISGLMNEEDILKLFSTKRRNQVRKTLNESIFQCFEDEEIRQEVWSSLQSNLSIRYQAKATHTYNEIVMLKKKFPNEIRSVYVYTKEGEYGAFALCFSYKNIMHTQYLDLNYKLAKKYPNLYLIFNLIKCARKAGIQYFSFGASTEAEGKILNYGLYNYKAEYGGGDIVLPAYTKTVRSNSNN